MIRKMIELTDMNSLHFAKLYDLKPIKKWSQDRVVLIGDAAHATTPNLGQGACQGIEDAYVLGELFKKYTNLPEIFSKYEDLRVKKAHYIVNTSWMIGKMAHITPPFIIQARNLGLKLMPQLINKSQMKKIFDINYKI